MQRRNNLEHLIQCRVIEWRDYMMNQDDRLRNLFAIPNGGLRNKTVAKKLKAEGVVAGIPDLFLAWPQFHCRPPIAGLFIEIKTPKGKLSEAQNERHKNLRRGGYQVEVCRSAEETIELIKDYLKM
jgi:hypothetical protein